MKRTDMLHALTTLLCQTPEPSLELYNKHYNDADAILTFLEDFGMAPPEIEVPTYHWDPPVVLSRKVRQWTPEAITGDDPEAGR